MKYSLGILNSKVMPALALVLLALALVLLASLAQVASAQSDEVLTLDIEPQEAGSALVTLARSSGVQIMLTDGAGSKIEVEGLKGQYRLGRGFGRVADRYGPGVRVHLGECGACSGSGRGEGSGRG